MKIGILTFHSQLNYGGVLQAYALQEFLVREGHDVVIVDRWLDAKNASLLGPFASFNIRRWLTLIVRGLNGCGSFSRLIRQKRTFRFIQRHLRRTRYHFYNWVDAPKDLGLDLIVVGSDQVWHCGKWGDPRPYLLFNAPNVRSISYAASLGMTEIPATWESVFKAGLSRFSSLSVRETEAVSLLERIGFRAAHVVDPTLLADMSTWNAIRKVPKKTGRDTLVCYYIAENINHQLPPVIDFAIKNNAEVKIFVDTEYRSFTFNIIGRLCEMLKLWRRNVRIVVGAGPAEFVNAIADAKWVVADSFHALMFATIFRKNVRIIRPREAHRKAMFARIEEFSQCFIDGSVIADSLPAALESLSTGRCAFFNDRLSDAVQDSREWLKGAIGRV